MERGATLFKEMESSFEKPCQPGHDKTERRTSEEEILVLDIRGAASFRKEVAENANARNAETDWPGKPNARTKNTTFCFVRLSRGATISY